LKRGAIRLSHYQRDFYGEPLFIFTINDVLVRKDFKGWSCDARQDLNDFNEQVWKARWNGWKTPIRWSCALNKDKKCCHVLAAEMLLELKGFKIGGGDSFFSDLPPEEQDLSSSPRFGGSVASSLKKPKKKVKK